QRRDGEVAQAIPPKLEKQYPPPWPPASVYSSPAELNLGCCNQAITLIDLGWFKSELRNDCSALEDDLRTLLLMRDGWESNFNSLGVNECNRDFRQSYA